MHQLKEQAKDLDPADLLSARLALRPERERAAASRLQATYGDKFKAVTLYDSKLDVRDMLGERAQRQSVKEQLKKKQPKQKQTQPKEKRPGERER